MPKINGKQKECTGVTVAMLLEDSGYDRQRVAVELNGDILPKCEYDNTVIAENDVIEVVSFVGGG